MIYPLLNCNKQFSCLTAPVKVTYTTVYLIIFLFFVVVVGLEWMCGECGGSRLHC